MAMMGAILNPAREYAETFLSFCRFGSSPSIVRDKREWGFFVFFFFWVQSESGFIQRVILIIDLLNKNIITDLSCIK